MRWKKGEAPEASEAEERMEGRGPEICVRNHSERSVRDLEGVRVRSVDTDEIVWAGRNVERVERGSSSCPDGTEPRCKHQESFRSGRRDRHRFIDGWKLEAYAWLSALIG